MRLFKYSVYVLAAGLALSGCKKTLDKQPTDLLSDSNAFGSLDDLQKGVYGAYGRYSAYANDMYVNALLSDEAKLGADNAGQGALTYRFQYSADGTTGGDVTSAYYGYYSLIDQANRVLAAGNTVSLNSAESARWEVLKAQLKALRGIAHFSLLEMYSAKYNANDPLGVPVMLVSNATGKPARNSVGQVMVQIEKDLSEAKATLPAVTGSNFSDTVMNKLNIAAYQARIALYKGDYSAAITYSTEVISAGVVTLSPRAAFPGIWTDDNVNEVLFKIRFETSTGIGGLWTTTNDQVYIAPSDKLRSSYTAADIRLSTYIGQNGSKYYVNKFYSSSRGGRVVHLKAARIAEMYLIRAEAYAKQATPNQAAATADLNTLRGARISGYDMSTTFANVSTLIDAIATERFKELAFEGFRFFDLKRTGQPVQRLSTDASPAWQSLAASSYLFVLPIPRDEIIANPNTVQNPGY